jgi:crossover junction endodeoxyribonuclease RusA
MTTEKLNLIVPFPPSVNSYWGFKGSRRFLTARAKSFKTLVNAEFLRSGHEGFANERLQITIALYPPDKRIRDIDNVVKSTLDALCQSGVFNDDGQIDVLHVTRENVIKWGAAKIILEPMPPPYIT